MQLCYENHLTLGRPKPSSKHAGSSSEAPLRSTNKVARKRRENETQRRPGCRFSELVEFLEYAAESANDPVYGKEALNKARQQTNGSSQSSKGSLPFKPKIDSFVSGLDTVPKSPSSHGTGSSNQNVNVRRCPLCEKSHDLQEDCDTYKKNSVEQRKSFLSEKALCYACYGKNHLSKYCTKKRTCKKCKRPHPTLLHIEGFSLDKESGAVNRETSGNDKPLKVNNACVDIPQ